MEHLNLSIIEKFFKGYSNHDLRELQQVLAEDVKWVFPGQNLLSGTKIGIKEVILFFDKMGEIMGKSKAQMKKLVMGVNDDYVLECQHICTNREEGPNFDQDMCVLWIFKDGKIIEGKHFTSSQVEVDIFFNML